MNLNLKDKVVVITGGSSGIGRGIADGFAAEQCKLAVCCDKNVAGLAAMEAEYKAKGIEFYGEQVDVSNHEAVQAFADHIVESFGRIDVWINNAGISILKPLISLRIDEFDRVLKVNLYSCFSGMQAAARHMRKTGGGVIINTSSIISRMPSYQRTAYAASKYGIDGLTRLAAGELAPFNIRVNAVSPGSIDTPLLALRPPEQLVVHKNKVASHRFGTTEEVAHVYLFLASDAASYVTGTVYDVDGGKFTLDDNDLPWTDDQDNY